MSASDTSPKAAGALSPADRFEINELIGRYNIVEDGGDVEGWVNTFTRDGGFTGLRRGNAIVGHDALREFGYKRAQRPDAGTYVHWATNIVITPTAEGARAQCYIMIMRQKPDGTLSAERMAVKNDELRREDGKWLFKSRVSVPWPETKVKYLPPEG